MSDHGEGFWEHGLFDHGNSYDDELLRVPLIVHGPGGARPLPPRVPTRVSTIDLAPTLLAMAGLPAAAELPGRSLLAPDSLVEQRMMFAEDAALLPPETAAVVEGSTKWLNHPDDQLFDLDADPGEQAPLAGHEAERTRLAETFGEHDRLEAALRQGSPAVRPRLPGETVERLRALGYAL